MSKAIAMIPARIGRVRLREKNLALVNGRPMVTYAIEAAKSSQYFDRIVLNSDGAIFAKIADQYSVEFYQRPAHLGSSTTKSDDVVADFIDKHPTEIVAWVNPVSPLQPAEEVCAVMEYFEAQGLDTLHTVKNEQVHCLFSGNPLNFNEHGKFAQTQDLTPVQRFVYSMMVWRTAPFREAMKEKGHAFFAGKVGYFQVCNLSSVIVKTEQDLLMVDRIAYAMEQGRSGIRYDQLVDEAGQAPPDVS